MLCRDSDVVVEEFRRDVRPVCPDQRVKLWMYQKLSKGLRISQGLKDRSLQHRLEVDFASGAIPKTKPDLMAADVPGFYDVVVHGAYSRGAIGFKG